MKHLKLLVAGLCIVLTVSFTSCQKTLTSEDESSRTESTQTLDESESTSEGFSLQETFESKSEIESENTSEASSEKESESESEIESENTSEASSEKESESEYESETETSEPIVFEKVNYSAIATTNVRMRTSPEIADDNIYGELKTGRGCTVIGYHEKWCQVLYQDNILYVATAYLVEGEEAKTITYANGTTNTLPSVTANGKKVAIDAGHQQAGISETEPNAPGSNVMKAKLTTGTQGGTTGIAEYILNLQVSMYLKEELLSRGYEVFMIRENNDCPLSNAERAVEANNSGSDIFVRIHANSSTNTTVSGGLTMTPSNSNPYVGYMADECLRLSTDVSNYMNVASGFKNMGVQTTDTMTGINWCSIPVTIVEMGFMSNPEEDQLMAQDSVRRALAKGIADGIDAYFGF